MEEEVIEEVLENEVVETETPEVDEVVETTQEAELL